MSSERRSSRLGFITILNRCERGKFLTGVNLLWPNRCGRVVLATNHGKVLKKVTPISLASKLKGPSRFQAQLRWRRMKSIDAQRAVNDWNNFTAPNGLLFRRKKWVYSEKEEAEVSNRCENWFAIYDPAETVVLSQPGREIVLRNPSYSLPALTTSLNQPYCRRGTLLIVPSSKSITLSRGCQSSSNICETKYISSS